ncbi:MAG: ATP-binding protein [Alphaproteobacteria bacterium]
MAEGPTLVKPLLATTALLAFPVALVLAGLVAFGRLDGGAAGIAFLAVVLALAALVRPHLAAVARLTRYLDALAEGEEAPQQSPLWPPLVVALASAAGRVRRRTQARRDELAARLASLEAVLDGLPDPLIMLDDRLRVVRTNAAAEELLADEPLGRELSAVFRVPALLDAAQSALRRDTGSTASFELASPLRRAFVARVERLAGSASDEVSLIMVLHDLTAEKRTEQMRADFVANASHELRTPLATLLGFIETLQGPASKDAGTRARFLAIMQQQASRMSRLVDDLLSLSDIELREHTAPTDEIDVVKVLRGVIDALQPLAKARDMPIVLELAGEEAASVLGHGDELAQVFQNLIDNALKYGRRGSAVRVAVRSVERAPLPLGRAAAAGLVAVAVADEGEGIAKEQIPRLTERFYRVDAARSRELGGTGLGLAIVKHIVSHHRGALQIESEIGKGSLFTVYLHAAHLQGTETQPRNGEEAEAPPFGHGTVISP